MKTRDRIRFGGTAIEYEVRRSERRKKTVEISVDGNGVRVAAPATTPDDDVRAIVHKRASWILSRATDATLAATPKRFVSGETLPYLGRNVRLIVEPTDVRSPEVRFDHWRFRITVPRRLAGEERSEAIRRAVIGWYRARAEDRLRTRVAHWWPHFGRGEPPRVLIRDQRRRWGSCAPDGTLRFNWRVVMVRPALIDYVVVHELAHLDLKGHSGAFWSAIGRLMADFEDRRASLRLAGPHLAI